MSVHGSLDNASKTSVGTEKETKNVFGQEDHESLKIRFDQSTEDEEPFTVFSKGALLRILVITSLTGMLSPLTANIYLPALNQIQEDLGISTEEVNLTVTVYMIFQAISPTFWGSLSDTYGRRIVLLATVFVYCGACVGLALTPNYACLLVFRMLQAFGSSSVIAVGAGIIGDLAERKKRGSYFGFYSTGQLLGPVLGPIIGGIVAEKLSWRWIFWILLILGAISIVSVGLFVQESLRSLVGNGAGYYNPTPFQWLARRRGKLDEELLERIKQNRNPAKLNFLLPFLYLLQPDVLIILVFAGLHYTCFYCFLTSTTKQFSIHYGLTELQIGLCFICTGVGTIVGSNLEGKLLDRDYRIIAKKIEDAVDNGEYEGPNRIEDFPIYYARFKSIWIPTIIIQALTILYGWCFILNAHLAVMLIIQFFVAACATAFMTCGQTLLVDLYPGKGASITASNNLVRCLLGAVATVCIDPGIEGVGTGWMFTIIGLILVVSNVSIPILIKYGPRWKERRAKRQQRQDQDESL
ncbi:MFS general substrate transporter [Backusella circina FSU 941]|nr:MFS general substrate transporter [Backusella circina FSU 941]